MFGPKTRKLINDQLCAVGVVDSASTTVSHLDGDIEEIMEALNLDEITQDAVRTVIKNSVVEVSLPKGTMLVSVTNNNGKSRIFGFADVSNKNLD